MKYPIKVYGPIYLKVNTNALGRAAAYTLEDYKVEDDTVYLKLKHHVLTYTNMKHKQVTKQK